MASGPCSLPERVCCGSWRTRWAPSEELKRHYPPRHSGTPRRGRPGRRRRPGRHRRPTTLSLCPCPAAAADYRDSAPEPLANVFELYQPVVQEGRWTEGLIEMWWVAAAAAAPGHTLTPQAGRACWAGHLAALLHLLPVAMEDEWL